MTRSWNPALTDSALDAIARTDRLLIALDFDGTASPLVDEPMAARAHPAVSREIERLTSLPETLVAFVSGRSMQDLRIIAEHGDDSPVALSGSHGAQYWFPGEGDVTFDSERPEPGELEYSWARAGEVVAAFENVVIEPKTFGLAVHTRRATAEAEAAAFAAADAFMAEQHPLWRRRLGHHVLEFSASPQGKDTAIDIFREKYHPSAILFAGDDVTDEDAMRALQPADLGVRVGAGETVATLRVNNPEEIADLLSAIAETRAAKGQQTQ